MDVRLSPEQRALRDSAARLVGRGAAVRVLDALALAGGERLPACDLVIDAAYGTGFRGDYDAPDPGGAPVRMVRPRGHACLGPRWGRGCSPSCCTKNR